MKERAAYLSAQKAIKERALEAARVAEQERLEKIAAEEEAKFLSFMGTGIPAPFFVLLPAILIAFIWIVMAHLKTDDSAAHKKNDDIDAAVSPRVQPAQHCQVISLRRPSGLRAR